MCCFSRPVPFVGSTKIFARAAADGRQLLTYAMNVGLAEELAMVLPLPVPIDSPDDAVRFIDLSAYPNFFTDLASAFPSAAPPGFGPQARSALAYAVPKLAVVEVGDFEASFVPRPADFARLDERFRLPPALFDTLPAYADYGFAVFRLKPRAARVGSFVTQTIHPMAFSFPRRDPHSVFFPTVHVHDGSVPSHANFDHALYCQPSALLAALVGWQASSGPIERFVDVPRSRAVVSGSDPAFAMPLVGSLPNEDLWLCEPQGVALADLEGRGECYAYSVRAAHGFTPATAHAMSAAWRETAQRRLPALCRGLATGLREFEAQSRGAFRLAPLTPDLPPCFLNGRQLWSGTSYLDGVPKTGSGPGRVRFTPFTKRVEMQTIDIAFARLPDADTTEAILRRLETILDAAVS